VRPGGVPAERTHDLTPSKPTGSSGRHPSKPPSRRIIRSMPRTLSESRCRSRTWRGGRGGVV